MRSTVEEGQDIGIWLRVGALDQPRAYHRNKAIRKCKSGAEAWGYQWASLISKDRSRDKVEARQIIMKYLRDSKWTYKDIGQFLGNRDHATAVYGTRQAEHLIKYDRNFRARWIEFQNA